MTTQKIQVSLAPKLIYPFIITLLNSIPAFSQIQHAFVEGLLEQALKGAEDIRTNRIVSALKELIVYLEETTGIQISIHRINTK